MNNSFHKQTLIAAFISVTVIFVGHLFAQDNDSIAKWLVSQSGRADNPCGLAVLPEGGPLALSLAKASQFLVVAQEADQPSVQRACAAAESAGLLGSRVVVAQSGSAGAVTAPRSANLLALARVTDAALAKLDGAALLDQVAPDGGRLIVGKAADAPGKLDRAALETWAKKLGSAELHQDAAGLFAVIVRGPLPKAAPWTHRFFDATGNAVSTDRAFAWPPMTQWMGKPYMDGGGMILVGDGVYVAITEGVPSISAQRIFERDDNAIIARDLNNGQVLWIKRMDPFFQYAGLTSPMAIHDGVLYVIAPKSKKVLRFDLHTGKDLGEWDASALDGDALKWLAIADGRLYLMAGGVDERQLPGETWKMCIDPFAALRASGAPDVSSRVLGPKHIGLGRGFGAFDLKTGKNIWTSAEETDCVYEFLNSVGNGCLYYLAVDKVGVCLDGTTGKPRWRNPELAEAMKEQEKQDYAKEKGGLGLGHSGATLVTPLAVVFYGVRVGPVAVDPADGHVLYRLPKTCHGHPLIAEDTLYSKSAAFDLRTGVKKGKETDIKVIGGCGVWSMTPDFVCSQLGLSWMFGNRTDLGADKAKTMPEIGIYHRDSTSDLSADDHHKSACGSGSMIAEGLFFQSGYQCSCPHTERGNIAQASAGAAAALATAPLDEAGSLMVGASGKPGPAVEAKDWPTYRGAVARGNASAAILPATAALRWTWKHPAPFTNPPRESALTLPEWESPQPLAVGDAVYAASADGAVRCLSLADGKPRWIFHTGSRILVTPAYADGKLYVGGGDGVLYCLNAGDGSVRWRFRLAHSERRVMAWGHLLSSWPVSSDIIVQDGVVYAAACLQHVNGAVVVALDAATGKIRWQNAACGQLDPQSRFGLETEGGMTIAQGRLWVRGNAFSLTNGALTVHPQSMKLHVEPVNQILSRVTGLMGDHLIWGGRRFWSEQHYNFASASEMGFVVRLNGDGTIMPEPGKTIPGTRVWNERQGMPLMPSWDHELVLITGRFSGYNPKTCWSQTARTLVALDQKAFLAACDDGEKPVLTSENGTKETPIGTCLGGHSAAERWRIDGPVGSRWLAMLLTADSVLAVNDPINDWERMAKRNGQSGYSPAAHDFPLDPLPADKPCQLIAYDRADGKERWRVSLPSEPVMDGLCVARDGSVIVQLLDGGVVCVGQPTH